MGEILYAILNVLPLIGLAGAVVGLTALLMRQTRADDDRWTRDRRKRERRETYSVGLPPPGAGERRLGERRGEKANEAAVRRRERVDSDPVPTASPLPGLPRERAHLKPIDPR